MRNGDETSAVEQDLLDLAKDINERRTVLKSKAATVPTELANVPKPPADAVLVPVLPGSITNSNHIKPGAMFQAAMNDRELLISGTFSPEQAALFTQWSLTYINQMSLTIPENQAAPMPNDLQTTRGMEDANAADKAKRDADDDDVDTEVSLYGSEVEVEENNRKGGDTVKTKKNQAKRNKSQNGKRFRPKVNRKAINGMSRGAAKRCLNQALRALDTYTQSCPSGKIKMTLICTYQNRATIYI